MTPVTPDLLEVWLKHDRTLARYVGAYLFQFFLYGFYTTLFAIGVYVLYVNCSGPMRWPFLITIAIMYSLATADALFALYKLMQHYLHGKIFPVLVPLPAMLLFVTSSIIADFVILFRCYASWYRQQRFIIIPCIILFCISICGYTFAISSSPRISKLFPIYSWMNFGFNACLTILISGKLWWSARRENPGPSPEMRRGYYFIMALIVESGAILPAYLLLMLTVKGPILRAGRNQVVGIAPTLIMLQAAMRICNQGVNAGIATQRRYAQSSSTPVLDSIFSTVGASAPTASQTPLESCTPRHGDDQHEGGSGNV
ncbi:hypothetical protein M413DRAFT_383958 [Hebeloma cylindrosporum]|uniref:G-protein coupled receptors family 1 profile domain-containing protein n=1 Tax=Hebeloma cylindrosporum TaxID=76867 RepID=A0A0C3CHD0_HEBCY|nr:hypothetical protein M413DRAFT_383958 [Hebeloma cylindrosporum h7]